MTIQILFTQFSQLTTTLESIAHIRSLILSAATSGALGQNDINDEPASELLARISSNFEDLVQKRIIRKPKRTEPLSDKVELELIPENWIWTRLGDVVDYGSSPKVDPGEIQESDWLLDLEDIEKSTSRLIRKKQFSEKPFKSTKTSFHAGDVLYGKLRPYLDKVIVANVRGYCTTEIIPIRTYGFIEPNYLRIALKRPSFIEYANRKSYGMNLPRLGTEDARNSLFPLPPLAEQKRIVAKVDELMALCDQLEAQQQERDMQHAALARASLARFANDPTPDNLQFLFHRSYDIDPADLRKTVLNLAIQGRLVSQDSRDEPARTLLINIENERQRAIAAKRISPLKRMPPVDVDELNFELRKGWELVRLIELVMEIQTGPFGSTLHKSDYQIGGTPVVNPASIQDGRIVPIGSMAIGSSTLERLKSYKLREGDIVLARRGEMGRCAVVSQVEDGWLCGTGSLVLRLPSEFFAPYLALLIGAPESRKYLTGSSVGATMQNLNQGILSKMPVGIPPPAEQRRIVAKVEQLMALVDELETQLASSREVAKNLLEALVAELTAA